MPDLWMDVDTALSEVPVNILPLLDDTDYKTRETAVAYDAAGMDLVWNFVLPDGTFTQTAVTPTSGGDYDWTNQGDGMYTIEIPASGGASINNDTEGFGWVSGVATGVLPWRGPVIGFRDSGLNDALIESAYSTTRGLAGTALPAAAADAAGGLPISDAGGLELDTFLGRITGNVALASVLGALTDAAADGDPTTADTLMQYVKQLINILIGTAGVVAFPAEAAPANAVSLAEVLRAIYADVTGLNGDAMRGTDGANTATPLDAAGVRSAVGLAAADLDTQLDALPTTAEVNAEVDTALADIHLDHLLATDYDPASKPGTGTALLNELVEDDGGVSRFTANALEQGPGGGSTPQVLIDTTIATVTTQTSFTLTAGSDQDDAYNGQSIVLYDASNSDFPCVRRVMDYAGSTKRVTLDTAPNFTIAASDGVKVFVSGAFASIKGATEVTDILIDDGTDPVEGAEVWITTGAAGTVTIWNGVTDALGVPKDTNDENPFLDPGTYYIWVQRAGYSFTNPTTLTVT